jgi:hypothetical protein
MIKFREREKKRKNLKKKYFHETKFRMKIIMNFKNF